jgi:hypothetical protein
MLLQISLSSFSTCHRSAQAHGQWCCLLKVECNDGSAAVYFYCLADCHPTTPIEPCSHAKPTRSTHEPAVAAKCPVAACCSLQSRHIVSVGKP